MRRTFTPRGACSSLSAVVAVLLGMVLAGCSDSNNGSKESTSTEGFSSGRQSLTGFLYANSTVRTRYAAEANVSVPEKAIIDKFRALGLNLNDKQLFLYSVEYQSTNLPSYAVMIKGEGNSKLFLYNPGHSHLTTIGAFSVDMMNMMISRGYDVLFVSMPLVGLNEIDAGQQYWAKFHGQAAPAPFHNSLISAWVHFHAVYQTISDNDNFLHFFSDTAFFYALESAPERVERKFVSPTVVGSGLTRGNYQNVSYLGLSGGGTVGLPICGLVKFDKCVLVAGFLPLYLRSQQADSWGDSEQIADSIYANYSYEHLMAIAATASKMVYIYNSHDTCCFSDPIATKFRLDFPQYDIRVVQNYDHSFDPVYIAQEFE